MNRRTTALTALIVAFAVGACSPAPGNGTKAGNNSGNSNPNACNEPCVLFHVQVDFSGLDNVSGSFVDNSGGAGYSSCADWAKGDGVGFAQGPGTPAGADTKLGGKSLTFLLSVTKDKFHGPGTYSDVLAGSAVGVGTDAFFGHDSTETLKQDGSGSASFSSFPGGSVTGPQGTESGNVTWTCSK